MLFSMYLQRVIIVAHIVGAKTSKVAFCVCLLFRRRNNINVPWLVLIKNIREVIWKTNIFMYLRRLEAKCGKRGNSYLKQKENVY